MKGLHMVAFILLIVGGLNWLLVGIFGWDVGQLFGGMDAPLSRIIYVLVGLAALVEIFGHKSTCRMCGKGKGNNIGMQQGGGQQM
ncbi:DUF378 domain-containing protein [Candidatus Wolfebacteria bacterium]|nr:DUF378 domain-containing protein [Candidatus Wolfebacteria bacterium]